MYDYAIVGGGPSGLTLGYLLHNVNKKIIIFDEHKEIGGCHRVKYHNNLHTEHGPRVYTGAYSTFWHLCKLLKIPKGSFTKYKYSLYSAAVKNAIINSFSIKELFIMCIAFLKYTIGSPSTDSVKQFCLKNKFSKIAMKQLNQLCSVVDGGTISTTVWDTFMNTIDNTMLYNIYQPTMPLDNLLWNKFKHLNIINEKIYKINHNVLNDRHVFKNIIFCVPPYALHNIQGMHKVLNINKQLFDFYCKSTIYQAYLCATFEFDGYVDDIWGNPETEYNEIFIDMGKYFKNYDRSLIIMCITNNNLVNHLSKEDLLNKMKKILLLRLNKNVKIKKATLSPNIQRIDNSWRETDISFLHTKYGFMDFINPIEGIYLCGHHMGNSSHKYNCIESALHNSIILANKLEPLTKNILKPKYNYTVSRLINVVVILLLLYLIRKFIVSNNV